MHGNSNETILLSGLHTSDPAEIKQMFLNLTAELENLKRQIDVLGDEKKLLQNRVFFLEVELNKLNSSKTPSSNELMAYLRSTKHIIQTLAANEEYDKNLTLRLNEAENNLAICVKQNKNLTQQLNEVVNNMAANEVYDKNVSQWLGVAMDNLNDLKIPMRYTSLSLLDVHSKMEELNTTVTRNYDDRIKDLHGRITSMYSSIADS
ncbi:uncharacterized protein LOC133204283 [Saccostrea echinata]|uniref:uncharacterized protein LOC133204283 n=1 Tax=Saccostrea echinata TaxID=191078 RepID=UPI002A813CFA|nr:uncharacterized protein LOC133204283 [Saccostrea echinata]